MVLEFKAFPKMARLSREIIITEKIDGTNAQVFIDEENNIIAGSRTRWITPEDDNFGFAKWVQENKEELLRLGAGNHFGEWWGSGIQRGYNLPKGEKTFSLFNTSRWNDKNLRPACCSVVPVLYTGDFDSYSIEMCLQNLAFNGSLVSPEFMNPEGITIYHTAANFYFKKTIKDDGIPKSLINH